MPGSAGSSPASCGQTRRSLRDTLSPSRSTGIFGGPGDFSADERVSVIVGQSSSDDNAKAVGGVPLLDSEYCHQKVIELNETGYYPYWYTGDREAASRVEAWELISGEVGPVSITSTARSPFTNPAGRDPNSDKVLAALSNLRAFIESFDFLRMKRDTTSVTGGVPSDASAQ